MNRKLYLTCLWPGLPELWWRGRLSALPSAIAFAAAVNFLLVARYVYPEWLTLTLVRMAGWVAVACWLFCVQRSVREMPALLSPRRVSEQPDRFGEAHRAYLRGRWAEAESLLADCLSIESRDPPALLLLAGVYRHTGRLEAAVRLIEEIRRTEAADRWFLEVAAEEQRLQRDRRFHAGDQDTGDDIPSGPAGDDPLAEDQAAEHLRAAEKSLPAEVSRSSCATDQQVSEAATAPPPSVGAGLQAA